MPLHRSIVGEDGDLAIVGPPERPGVLTLDTDGLGPLLGKAGLVRIPDGIVLGQDREHPATHRLEDRVIGPDPGADEGLQGANGTALQRLGDVLGIAPLAAVEQPLDEAACVRLILIAAKKRREAVEEAIEFGFQGQELLLVHERSPRDGGKRVRVIALIPDRVLA